jgi:hypothetical protein
MPAGAHVKSIEALEGFRASLGIFGEDVEQALEAAQVVIARFMNWLEHDQLAYWRHQIRVRDNRLAEAKAELHRCLSATIDPRRTPSCYQEKKCLEAAKRHLDEAEIKLAAVRRWIPIIRKAIFEYRLKVEPLESAVASDVPRGMAFLKSSVERLEAYLNIAPPGAQPASQGDASPNAQAGSMALPTAATAPAKADTSEAPEDATAPGQPPERLAGLASQDSTRTPGAT